MSLYVERQKQAFSKGKITCLHRNTQNHMACELSTTFEYVLWNVF